MGPVAQLVFKTSAVVQPTARSVRLRRRSVEPKPAPLGGFRRLRGRSHRRLVLPLETARDRWRLALTGAHWRATGAHLARESEITPSSPKVRRELFEIALQDYILIAAR
jgi:hypothetical protein